MTREELIAALANVLAGLQVPLSIDGKVMLGAANEPYREILAEVGFGWHNAEQFQEWLTQTL
jgi:hypothetical protein